QPQWPAVCRAIGRPELAQDPRYDTNEKRVAAADEVIAIVQEWVAAQPSDEAVIAALERERVPCAPVLTIADVANHPHMRGRGTVRTVADEKLGEVLMPGMPLHFSGFAHNQPLTAAALGEHNAFVLGELLGYDAARISGLAESGVLFGNPDT
ncbi:MAG: CoA transferase, partial [Gammaproteobacteria bacterium]